MVEALNGKAYAKVRYMIAAGKEDYDRVGRFLKGTIFEGSQLTFPTIIAIIDGQMKGVLGTYQDTKAIVAGPLLVKDKTIRRATLELKLVDAYESILINYGVQAYIFSVDEKDKARISMLAEIGLKPYGKADGDWWYLRRF